MKVLAVAPHAFLAPSPASSSVYYRTLVMAECGADVELLTFGGGEQVSMPDVALRRIPRMRILEPVGNGPSLSRLIHDVALLAWTVVRIAVRRPEVVHAHDEAGVFCRALKPLFRFKLVHDMHSTTRQRLVGSKFAGSQTAIRVADALDSVALSAADAVITSSPQLAEIALAAMLDPARHHQVENSIFETIRLARRPRAPATNLEPADLPRGRPVIAYVGSFESHQGVDVLLQAFVRVRRRIPDAFLLLVGGTTQQVEYYRSMTRSLGVDDDVMFTGWLPQSHARRFQGHATVVTSPRRAGSSTPLKIYELLDSGIPLVATRVESHTQVLDDDVCFLVGPEPESMAAGIIRVIEDPAHARHLTRAARELYCVRYSRDSYEQKMRRLFEALNDRASPPG